MADELHEFGLAEVPGGGAFEGPEARRGEEEAGEVRECVSRENKDLRRKFFRCLEVDQGVVAFFDERGAEFRSFGDQKNVAGRGREGAVFFEVA